MKTAKIGQPRKPEWNSFADFHKKSIIFTGFIILVPTPVSGFNQPTSYVYLANRLCRPGTSPVRLVPLEMRLGTPWK
jgi:hypothetical protein